MTTKGTVRLRSMDSASHFYDLFFCRLEICDPNFQSTSPLVTELIDVAVQFIFGSEQSYDSTNNTSANESDNYCDDHAEQLSSYISCDNDSGESSEESRHTVEVVNSACVCAADKLLNLRSNDAVAYSTKDSGCNTDEH